MKYFKYIVTMTMVISLAGCITITQTAPRIPSFEIQLTINIDDKSTTPEVITRTIIKKIPSEPIIKYATSDCDSLDVLLSIERWDISPYVDGPSKNDLVRVLLGRVKKLDGLVELINKDCQL